MDSSISPPLGTLFPLTQISTNPCKPAATCWHVVPSLPSVSPSSKQTHMGHVTLLLSSPCAHQHKTHLSTSVLVPTFPGPYPAASPAQGHAATPLQHLCEELLGCQADGSHLRAARSLRPGVLGWRCSHRHAPAHGLLDRDCHQVAGGHVAPLAVHLHQAPLLAALLVMWLQHHHGLPSLQADLLRTPGGKGEASDHLRKVKEGREPLLGTGGKRGRDRQGRIYRGHRGYFQEGSTILPSVEGQWGSHQAQLALLCPQQVPARQIPAVPLQPGKQLHVYNPMCWKSKSTSPPARRDKHRARRVVRNSPGGVPHSHLESRGECGHLGPGSLG